MHGEAGEGQYKHKHCGRQACHHLSENFHVFPSPFLNFFERFLELFGTVFVIAHKKHLCAKVSKSSPFFCKFFWYTAYFRFQLVATPTKDTWGMQGAKPPPS